MSLNSDYHIVCAYLNSLNIHFCKRWVLECMNNLKSTYPGLSTNDLKTGVYERWLSSNLRDFKVQSFPSNISSCGVITLSGAYAVQVESMVNSARSCYSELQKIENPGKYADITGKSDEGANSKRCLTFVLCDGVQEVQAMEYQFIPHIKLNDPDFFPGFKMIVKGPVVCRKGMLLLKQENVKIYGGKVDSLCEVNNLKKLLRTKLGLSSNNEENNTHKQVVRYDHPPTQNLQPREITQSLDNNFSDGIEMDELLSQNDDILLSLSFEPGFEGEYNQNYSRQEVKTKGNSCQNLKKPKLNSSDDAIQENSNNQVLSNKTGSLKCYPHVIESQESASTKKAKLDERELVNSGSTFKSNNNQITPFSESGDIIMCDDTMFQSQWFPKKTGKGNSSKTPGKCTEMKMSSYLTSFEEPNTSSNCIKKQAPKNIMSYPFVYLKQIAEIAILKPTAFTVKAIILTLKSKISIKNDEFALKACISDGSGTFQVNFSSQTLENILEYSPCEVTSMINEKDRNSAIGGKLKGIFFSAQQKLLSMNCLMKIQFFNGGATPLVVGLEEIQLEHVNALKARSF